MIYAKYYIAAFGRKGTVALNHPARQRDKTAFSLEVSGPEMTQNAEQ